MTEKKAISLCRKYVKAWYKVLGLADWKLYLIAMDEEDTPVQGEDYEANGYLVRAWVDCFWEYKSIRINILPKHMLEDTEEAIEEHMVHELLHAVVNEMRDHDDGKHEERVVTTLTQAFLDLRDGVNKVGK